MLKNSPRLPLEGNVERTYRRYFKIAGITVCVESGLDFDTVPFKKAFAPFAVAGPGDDNVTLRHHFELPGLQGKDLGVEVYRKAPWAISHKNGTWFYKGISTEPDDGSLHRVAVFENDYTSGTIYSPPGDAEHIRADGWPSLSLFPTDQIWLGPLLADRSAVLLHSARGNTAGAGTAVCRPFKCGQVNDNDTAQEGHRRRDRRAAPAI